MRKEIFIYNYDIYPSIRIGECVTDIRLGSSPVSTGFVTKISGNGVFETETAIFMPTRMVNDDEFEELTFGGVLGG